MYPPLSINFITPEEREQNNKKLVDAGGFIDNFNPGSLYYMPWINDPESNKPTRYKIENFTSKHYVERWASLRPPLCVVLPNNKLWFIDGPSANGNGWTVSFDDDKLPGPDNRNPKITAFPSIVVNDYHGWLRSGVLIPV